jgi:putative hydrolase of the HAD superfamily
MIYVAMKKRIKAVIFDIGGVLELPRYYVRKGRHEYSGIHESIAHRLGITSDEWFDVIDNLYAKAIVGAISRREFVREVSRRLGISEHVLVKSVKQEYTRGMKKNEYLYTLAKKLRKQGIIVGVLSDQWHLSRESIFSKHDEKLFDIVIISYEVKTRKPHPDMYTILFKRLHKKYSQIHHSDIVFIDDKKYNLVPAQKLGMKTILFKNNAHVIRELKKYGV